MDKGSILYLGGFELPDKNAAAHRVIVNGKLLQTLGYNVIYCGIAHNKQEFNIDKPSGSTHFDSYPIPYPRNFYQWLKYFFELKKYHDIIVKYGDVKYIICYNLPTGSLFLLRRYFRDRRIKIIADCTEWYLPQNGSPSLMKYAKKIDTYLRMKILHPKLDGIIAISRFLYDYYRSKHCNVVEIPPLIDAEESKWNNSFCFHEGRYELVYAGTPFALKKGSLAKDRLDRIIDGLIVTKKSDIYFRLNIIGLTKAQFLEIYPQFVQILDDEFFIFYGKVSHLEALQILKKCDFSIFVRDENIVTKAGFPTKFVESISAGIPVLTNRNSNVANYLKESENGFLLDMGSQARFVESIILALRTNRMHLLEMKRYCYHSKVFDYHKYMDDFDNLLTN